MKSSNADYLAMKRRYATSGRADSRRLVDPANWRFYNAGFAYFSRVVGRQKRTFRHAVRVLDAFSGL